MYTIADFLLVQVSFSRFTLRTSCARGHTICPAHVCHTVLPSSSPSTPYTWPAAPSVALLPVAVGAMNSHDVRDRQTNVRCASSLNAP